jgi:SAM-dependent methyltransferase
VTYPIEDGVPDLVGKTDAVNHAEVATQDHVSELYELERYRRPHARAMHLETVARMAAMVRLDGRVLDDGCGNGFLFDSGVASSATSLVGIDLSRGMLAKARKHGARLVRGDSTRLPFAAGSFDTVFARSLLHHLPEPAAGVREIARVLRPGGEMVVLDTNKTFVSALPRAIANRGEHFDEGHKNFVARELVRTIGEHLVVDRVEYAGYVAYPLLGFPDLIDFGRFLPLGAAARALVALDRRLASIPVVKKLAWGVIVKAHKAG